MSLSNTCDNIVLFTYTTYLSSCIILKSSGNFKPSMIILSFFWQLSLVLTMLTTLKGMKFNFYNCFK